MKNKIFVVGLLCFVVIGFVGATLYFRRAQTTGEVFRVDSKRLVRTHSFVKGSDTAKVTLVEFFDPECEACRAMHKIVDSIGADYGDRLRIVYRFTPLHPGSEYASSVLLEAQEVGKFEAALNLLFENQPEWGSHDNPQPDLIPQYLKSLGFSADQLDRDLVIAKHKAALSRDRDDSAALLVQQTLPFL